MTLAVAALFADGPCRLRNIASWRVKETDRIAAMATELRKLGAEVEEGADFLGVTPPAEPSASCRSPRSSIRHLRRPPHGDVFFAGRAGRGAVRINDPHCVAKTFPDYFERFAAGHLRARPRSGHRDRRAVGVRQGHGGPARGAEHLGFHYLDSGALYRLVALGRAATRGVDLAR